MTSESHTVCRMDGCDKDYRTRVPHHDQSGDTVLLGTEACLPPGARDTTAAPLAAGIVTTRGGAVGTDQGTGAPPGARGATGGSATGTRTGTPGSRSGTVSRENVMMKENQVSLFLIIVGPKTSTPGDPPRSYTRA